MKDSTQEMIEGPEAWQRFRNAMKAIIKVPKSAPPPSPFGRPRNRGPRGSIRAAAPVALVRGSKLVDGSSVSCGRLAGRSRRAPIAAYKQQDQGKPVTFLLQRTKKFPTRPAG